MIRPATPTPLRTTATLQRLLLAGAVVLAGCGGTMDPDAASPHDDVLVSDHATAPTDAAPDAMDAAPDAAPDAARDVSTMPDVATDAPSTGPLSIAVSNLASGDVLPHDLIVLDGTITSRDSTALPTTMHVTVGSDSRTWPVVAGTFKAVAILHAGANDVVLDTGHGSLTLPLTYTPQTNPYQVRFLWAVASDGTGEFDAPAGMPHATADAQARIALSARLMQTFTAEVMNRAHLGRRTFNLQRDATGAPMITVLHTRVTTAAAHAMTDNQLYDELYNELNSMPDREHFNDVVYLGMSHYNPATHMDQAHAALGGNFLAIISGSGLFTWATSLDDLVARWSDTRMVDTSMFNDDSAGRGTWWANYSTTCFDGLHELGHTLSLPHAPQYTTIMYRGFDTFNRMFMPYEEPHPTTVVTVADEPTWDPSAINRFHYHRFLDLTPQVYASQTPPTFHTAGTTLTISDAVGLRHIAYTPPSGFVQANDVFTATPPTSHAITFAALRARMPSDTPHPATVNVNAIDAAGNIADTNVTLP